MGTKAQLPTVTLAVAARSSGKTKALIETLLQQADARGLRVEIVEPTHTVADLTEQLRQAQGALAAIARLMDPARLPAVLGKAIHTPVPVSDTARVLDYVVQRTSAIRDILKSTEEFTPKTKEVKESI